MSMKATAHYHGHSKRGGIYKILNTLNGRFYYGSAKEFKSRWKIHLKNLRGNRHSNRFLQADFNKCGEVVFEFHVIEIVLGDRKARTAVEDGYLKEHHDNQQQCYNFAKTADSLPRSVFSKDPDATRKLLSEKLKKTWAKRSNEEKQRLINTMAKGRSKETYKKISKALKGKKKSKKHVEKMAKSLRGRKNGPHTEEAKLKMSLNRKNRKIIKVTDLQTNNVKQFHSQAEAARQLNISAQTISNALRGLYKKGYKSKSYHFELV